MRPSIRPSRASRVGSTSAIITRPPRGLCGLTSHDARVRSAPTFTSNRARISSFEGRTAAFHAFVQDPRMGPRRDRRKPVGIDLKFDLQGDLDFPIATGASASSGAKNLTRVAISQDGVRDAVVGVIKKVKCLDLDLRV
jgi:hypothetical protein